MAGKPKEMRGKYYSRIYIPISNGKYKEKLVPLNTSNKLEAESRMVFVRQAEGAIKNGEQVTLPWQNGTNKVQIERYTLTRAIDEYLDYKSAVIKRPSTIERIEYALRYFEHTFGRQKSINDITIEDIDAFIKYYSNNNRHEPTTININLDKIKTMLRWLHDRNKIDTVPKITKLKVGKPLPKYVTDDEWNRLMNLDKVYRKHYNYYESFGEDWKQSLYLYRETGCRPSEPFLGELEGNWLIVYTDKSKTIIERQIHIPDVLIPILNQMREKVVLKEKRKNYKPQQSYSRKFSYACDTLGIKKRLYDLRHTFAVRRYLQTRDIYLVAKEMGHTTVKTTEKYARFDLRRLGQDFPTINGMEDMTNKSQNHVESYTNHRIQIESQGATVVGKV